MNMSEGNPPKTCGLFRSGWNNGTNFVNVVGGAGIISANPLFVAPGDLHVTAGSPVIDAGNGSGAPTHDYDGAPRPLDGDGIGGAAHDMSVYEYSATAPTPGSVPEANGGPRPICA